MAARGHRPANLFEEALIADGALGSRLIFARNRAYPLLVTSIIPYTAESELAERRGLPLSSDAAGRLLLMSEIDDLDNIAQLAASGAVRRKPTRNFGHILKPSWIRSGCLSDSDSEDKDYGNGATAHILGRRNRGKRESRRRRRASLVRRRADDSPRLAARSDLGTSGVQLNQLVRSAEQDGEEWVTGPPRLLHPSDSLQLSPAATLGNGLVNGLCLAGDADKPVQIEPATAAKGVSVVVGERVTSPAGAANGPRKRAESTRERRHGGKKGARESLVDGPLDLVRERAASEETVRSASDSSTSESSLSSGEQAARRRVRDAGALVEDARDLVRLYACSLLGPDLASAPEGMTRDLPKLEAMGIRASVIQYTAAEDRVKLQQEQFEKRHTWINPGLELKLQALRVMRQSLVRVREECHLQLVTAAHAWCLFEFLIWRSRINAANMKVALGACVLLAVKFMEPASESSSKALQGGGGGAGGGFDGGMIQDRQSGSYRLDGHGHGDGQAPALRLGAARGGTGARDPAAARETGGDPGPRSSSGAGRAGSGGRGSGGGVQASARGVASAGVRTVGRIWRAVHGFVGGKGAAAAARGRARWSSVDAAAATPATQDTAAQGAWSRGGGSGSTGAAAHKSGRLVVPVPPAQGDGAEGPDGGRGGPLPGGSDDPGGDLSSGERLDQGFAAGASARQAAPSLLRAVAAELSDAGLAISGFMQPFLPLGPGNSPLRRTPQLLSAVERHIGAARREVLHVEMDVFALLGFSMHLPLRVLLPQLGAMRKACRPQPWDVPSQMPPDLDPRWWARRRLHEASRPRRKHKRGKAATAAAAAAAAAGGGGGGGPGREAEDEEEEGGHKSGSQAKWEEVYERAAVPSMAFYQPIADADGDVSSSEDEADEGVGAAGGAALYDRDDEDAEAEEDAADADAMEQEEDAAEEEEEAVHAARSPTEHEHVQGSGDGAGAQDEASQVAEMSAGDASRSERDAGTEHGLLHTADRRGGQDGSVSEEETEQLVLPL